MLAIWSRVVLTTLTLGAAACAARTPRVDTAGRDGVYATLAGRWRGTLEYKDYRDSTRRVTLPTLLEVSPDAAGDGVVLDFTYDDGPGKTVRSSDRLSLDAQSRTARWGGVKDTVRQAFVVSDLRGAATADGTPVLLVLEGEGSDDDAPATIRETISAGPDTLHILKETRPRGGAFAFRHRYAFTRVR